MDNMYLEGFFHIGPSLGFMTKNGKFFFQFFQLNFLDCIK